MEGEEDERTPQAPMLTEEQKKRIETNREKAKALRKKRIHEKPYARPNASSDSPTKLSSTSPRKPTPSHVTPTPPTGSQWNTYGGYILDDDEQAHGNYSGKIVEEDAPPMPDERPTCEECKKEFAVSYLLSKFQLSVCDSCRDHKEKHSLITKTEAKQRFLLRDSDFEESGRGPALSFILKKNPHSSRWGEMKLFLQCQVEERSHKIWGGEAGLEEEHQNKVERREKKKEKKYAKEIKELRRAVRSSLVQSTSSKYHEHIFPADSETYDPDSDTWTKTCSDCGYKVTFEKM